MRSKLSSSFVRRQQFISPAESTVKPYELELSVLVVFVLSAVYIAYDLLTEPRGGHPFGHWLGIIGTVLMVLTEVMYSVRKRTSLLNWAGPVRYWLSLHIFTGIVGPFMVLMHTGLQFRGLAGISFLLTLIVVGSGFIGRYLYTALPRTLSGVTTSKQALVGEITAVSTQINQFEITNSAHVRELVATLGNRTPSRSPILTIFGRSWFQWRYERRIQREMRKLNKMGTAQREQLTKLLTRKRELERQTEMLETARRLLRIWHILHIPFGLTLFFSVTLHVVATIYFRAGLFR
jgi:hypothetical protein